MATETITLTDSEYTQITDGTQGAYLQVMTLGASMLWVDSPTKPAVNGPHHEQPKELVAGSSLQVWARARSGKMNISVTRYSE